MSENYCDEKIKQASKGILDSLVTLMTPSIMNSIRDQVSKRNDLHGYGGGGWIGVDLDGTLARYDGWKGAEHIGEPIPKMVKRVLEWMQHGPEVRIMTARVSPGKGDSELCRQAIEKWLEKYVYSLLPASFVDAPVPFPCLKVTHEKDHKMIELWDDRCVQVIPNTGERADGKE